MTARTRHTLGAHLALGLGLLHKRTAGRVDRWRRAGTRPGDRSIRTGCLILAAGITVRILTAAWPLLLAAALGIIALALRTATRHVRAQDTTQEAPAKAAEDDDQEQPAEPTPEEFLALLHRVIGTAAGVHLKTLAAALTQQYGGAWDVADVRRLCEAAGQPTRPTVRAPGAGPTVGIHREDLLPLPQQSAPAPDPAVVAAGQPGTTAPTTAAPTTSTTPTTTVHGGLRVTTTPDPDNPHRHAVRVLDTARRRRP